MTSVQNLKYSLTNLSRCAIVLTTNKNNNSTKVIQEENLQDFPLKHNSFIVNSCDQKCVTSPKLWTQLCEKFNFKALTFNQFDLILVKDLLKDDSINIGNVRQHHAFKKYDLFAVLNILAAFAKGSSIRKILSPLNNFTKFVKQH